MPNETISQVPVHAGNPNLLRSDKILSDRAGVTGHSVIDGHLFLPDHGPADAGKRVQADGDGTYSLVTENARVADNLVLWSGSRRANAGSDAIPLVSGARFGDWDLITFHFSFHPGTGATLLDVKTVPNSIFTTNQVMLRGYRTAGLVSKATGDTSFYLTESAIIVSSHASDLTLLRITGTLLGT